MHKDIFGNKENDPRLFGFLQIKKMRLLKLTKVYLQAVKIKKINVLHGV